MDRQRYIPGDQVLHPGTGRTDYYQDVNGAVFRQVTHDAHGNNFTTNYALDPATRYGYTVPGGHPRHQRHSAPASYMGPTPAGPYISDSGANYNNTAAYWDNEQSGGGGDGAAIVAVLILVFFVAVWPLWIARTMHRAALRRGRDVRYAAITIALVEPAWLLFLWHLIWGHAWWPAAVALAVPIGYAAIKRWAR